MSRARKTRRTTWRQLHSSPLAVTLDGSVVASVGLYDGIEDATAAIRAAVAHGGRVFVGVELREAQVVELRRLRPFMCETCTTCFSLSTRMTYRRARG